MTAAPPRARRCRGPGRVLGTLALALTLTACGFQLRGSYRLPEALFPLHVEAPSGSDVARVLRAALARQDVVLTDDPERAAARLVILDDRAERRILSVGESAKVEEYELRRTVRWTLERRAAETTSTLIPPNELEARRDYRFDPNAVLSKQQEEEALDEQISGDLAQRILFRLQAWEPGGA